MSASDARERLGTQEMQISAQLPADCASFSQKKFKARGSNNRAPPLQTLTNARAGARLPMAHLLSVGVQGQRARPVARSIWLGAAQSARPKHGSQLLNDEQQWPYNWLMCTCAQI